MSGCTEAQFIGSETRLSICLNMLLVVKADLQSHTEVWPGLYHVICILLAVLPQVHLSPGGFDRVASVLIHVIPRPAKTL
jgi:hypothetical protein